MATSFRVNKIERIVLGVQGGVDLYFNVIKVKNLSPSYIFQMIIVKKWEHGYALYLEKEN